MRIPLLSGLRGLVFCAPLVLLCAVTTSGPASASCNDYSRYWHVVGQLELYGVAVALSDGYAFTAGDQFFSVVDVSEPADPRLAARIPLAHTAIAQAVSGGVACVSEQDYEPIASCFQVIDISDPVNPTVKATMADAGGWNGVTISGSLAFVLRGSSLDVIDLSSLDEPAIIGSVALPGNLLAVAVSGPYAYVASGDWQNPADQGLYVIDVSVPESPFVAAFQRTRGRPVDFALAGSLAFVAAYSDLVVIDLTDPLRPSIAGSVPFVWEGFAGCITLAETTAYVSLTGGFSGLQAIDVSDPSNPRLLDVLMGGTGRGFISGDYLYVPGFSVVDIREPANPTPVGAMDIANGSVLATETRAYLTNENGLTVLDVTNPSDPRFLSALEIPGSGRKTMTRDFLYVLWAGGVLQIDISGPNAPMVVGGFGLQDAPNDVAVSPDDSHAYVVTGSTGLTIVENHETYWWVTAVLDTPGYAQGVEASGSYVYVAAHSAGVQVIDVSNPWDPQIVATFEGDYAYDLTLSGDLLYVDGRGLWIIDVHEPTNPRVLSRSPAECQRIDVQGSMAYLTSYYGVDIRDVSDPTQPRRVGYLSVRPGIGWPPLGFFSAAAQGSLVYTSFDNRLQIFRPQCAVADVAGDGGERTGMDLRVMPNPTSRAAEIDLEMPCPGPLEVSIHDPTGRLVRRLLEGSAPAGLVQLAWDGLDDRRREARAGVYFVRAKTAGAASGGRIVLMR